MIDIIALFFGRPCPKSLIMSLKIVIIVSKTTKKLESWNCMYHCKKVAFDWRLAYFKYVIKVSYSIVPHFGSYAQFLPTSFFAFTFILMKTMHLKIPLKIRQRLKGYKVQCICNANFLEFLLTVLLVVKVA